MGFLDCGLFAVMVAAGGYKQLPVLIFVDQPVFRGDPPRPVALQVALKGLGLADALKRCAHAALDQFVDPLHYFPVDFLPIQVILPGGCGPDQPHLFYQFPFGALPGFQLPDGAQQDIPVPAREQIGGLLQRVVFVQ